MLEVESRRVVGTWWRHLPAGGDPLWRPVDPADGRWQRGLAVGAMYLADGPDTAWAEWYRALAELGVPPRRALPRDLWRATLDVEVADLRDRDRLRAVGLDMPRPDRREWSAFQALGEQLRSDGWAGLIAPSAARPSRLVVCLFRATDYLHGVSFIPPPQPVADPPAPPRGMTT